MNEASPAIEPVERPAAAERVRRSGWRLIAHWTGVACLMVAAGFGGYVVWLLWGTGLTTAHAQTQLRQDWPHRVNSRPVSAAPALVPLGTRYAEIQIPSIGVDMMVVQGTAYPQLKLGPGHYPDTANPWDSTGRVGIAGHRTTYLHPFFNLNKVQVGDTITLRTVYGTYLYRVDRAPFVIPEAGSGVVLTQTKHPTLVLTTCNPKYESFERLIVTATRV